MKPRHDDGNGWKRGEGAYSKSGPLAKPKAGAGEQRHFISYEEQAACRGKWAGKVESPVVDGRSGLRGEGRGSFRNSGIDGGGKNSKTWGKNPSGPLSQPEDNFFRGARSGYGGTSVSRPERSKDHRNWGIDKGDKSGGKDY